MIKRLVFAAILFSLVITACNKNTSETDQPQSKPIPLSNNKFYYNPDLRKILQYHNQGDIKHLVGFLDDTLPETRYYALLSLGSLGDTSHLYQKINMLDDTSALVRRAAAYVIGLQSNSYAEDILVKHYYNETDPKVRSQILEALGHCGTSHSLYFLANLSTSSPQEQEGVAWGLVYFAIRGIVSNSSNKKAIELLTSYKSTEQTKRIISQYFYQPAVKINDYYKQLIHVFNNTGDTITKTNLLLAISRVSNKQVLDFLQKQIQSQSNQIQVVATQGIARQHLPEVPRIMSQLVRHSNSYVAQIAAQYFIYNGTEQEANYYFELARTVHKWLPRSLLLHASLKYATDSLKEKFANSIISGFKASKNPYEQSYLLASMAFYPQKYEFVRDQAFYAPERIITTTAVRTLVRMRLLPNFDQIARQYYQEQGFNLNKEFGQIFKETLKKGDNAQIFYASIILKNKNLHLLEDYENTFFINQALGKLQLPRDLKVYKSVCKLYNSYTGDTCSRPIYKMSEVDWDLAPRIADKTRVRVRTTKGDFIIELYPEKAPATVSTFLKLVTQGYYNGTYVYKVIPNKTVWISSRRGDGWPDVNIAHPVMLYPYHFEPGTVAMNLIDKGVESVQWFIVLNPSANMDGKYTAFGKVVSGLHIARDLEIGDKIIAVEIY